MNRYKQLALLLVLTPLIGCTSNSNHATYFSKVLKQDTLSRDQLIDNLPVPFPAEFTDRFPENQICVDAYEYNTVAPDGKDQIASGIISYPVNGQFKGVVVAQHFTLSKNSQVPSQRMGTIESILSLYGYVVISADYLGYGSSANIPHPYMHVKSMGRSTVDMVFAARERMSEINRPIADSVYVVGYSQGGQAALAFQKEAEENYAKEIPIIRSIVGGGTYDVMTTVKELIRADTTELISAVPVVILGLDYGDNLQLDYTKLFKEPLLTNYPAWILSKQYETARINRKIDTKRISDILTESVLTGESIEIEKFYKSCVANSLIDWTPKAPILLIHGKKDRVTLFVNALNAYESFKSKGCDVTLHATDLSHLETNAPFYKILLKELTGVDIEAEPDLN